MGFRSVCVLPIFILVRVETVPPDACFANFRWDDCGKSPEPVMYYWKPGSRCEVGLWRGCLPNLNMFADEYECVTTCIFTSRALPEAFHSMNENEIEDNMEDATVTTESGNSTDVTTGPPTGGGDTTNAANQGAAHATTSAGAGEGTGEHDSTQTGGTATTGGLKEATTEAPAA